MELSLGKKIRELRKARGVTQEELAGALGISFQAVSKWETEIALPDVTMTPAIARYFGVTMDVLFDFDLREVAEKVDKICHEAWKYRDAEPEKARGILNDGLRQYPDNDILLNNLLYTYDPDEAPDDVINLAARLIDKTDQADVRYDAVRFLAYAYRAKGDEKSALDAIEQIPEIYFSKLSELAFVANGETKRKAADKEKWISFERVLDMMAKLAEVYEASGNIADALRETENAGRLLAALETDPQIGAFAKYRDDIAKSLARLKVL